jgi:class 3 adenylate cyclase
MSYVQWVTRCRNGGDKRVEAERRHLVILFADVVGFTAFSERFGDEAAFGLTQSLSRFMERVVEVEGARIQDILGDGVMVVFSAPVAHEDAPLRACRASAAPFMSRSAMTRRRSSSNWTTVFAPSASIPTRTRVFSSIFSAASRQEARCRDWTGC